MIKKLAMAVALFAVTVAVARWVFGIHIEMDGTGWRPYLGVSRPDAHYAELERHRANQSRVPSPPSVVEQKADVGDAEPAAAEKSSKDSDADPDPTPAPGTMVREEPAHSPYWTDFRGPRRDGRYDQMPIRTDWPATGLPQVWREPVGGGYSSFTVAGGKAFTLEQRRNQEVATAYDLATGRELWANGWDAYFKENLGGDGPRSTPTWHQGRIYVLGAEGELRCLDARTGKKIWSRNILTDNQAQNLQWGMSGSPLIVDDNVIVQPGGPDGKSVAAYNKMTGEPVWRAQSDRQAYASPMLATLAGVRQVLVVSAQRAMGIAPESGKLLWEFPWSTQFDINVAQPVVIGDNRVFLSAGYGHGGALLELSKTDSGLALKNLWSTNRMKNKFTTSVLHEGYLYGLDEAILACIDAQTGELKWKGGRYGYGEVALASGHLIVTTESGEVVLVKATPESFQEISRFQAVSGKTWNHPALADGMLLVRNETEMACFRIGAK